MSHAPKQLHLPGQPVIHSTASLYVVTRASVEPAARRLPGGCQILCDYQRGEDGRLHAAMMMFLSPFDACFEAAWCGLPAEQYLVAPPDGITPHELVGDGTGQLRYGLHFAWGARDGALAVRRQGALVRMSAVRAAKVSGDGEAFEITPSPADRDCYRRMWDCAGLFAQGEMQASFLACSPRQRNAHALRAIQRIPATVGAVGGVNQLALYDVESAQWHFIPVEAFAHTLRQGAA